MTEPQPYKISVPSDALTDLQQRLALAKLPTQLESDEQDLWDFGTPVKDVKRLVEYWKNGFDWRKAETKLNQLPQYQTKIEVDEFGSLDIHCECPFQAADIKLMLRTLDVHQVNENKNAIPLLFSHGCKCEAAAPNIKISFYITSLPHRARIIH